jgi:hypothetical protein
MLDLQMQKRRIHKNYESFDFDSRMSLRMKSGRMVIKLRADPLTVQQVKKRQE